MRISSCTVAALFRRKAPLLLPTHLVRQGRTTRVTAKLRETGHLQAGAAIRVLLDREAIQALQLGITAYSVRTSILASKFHKDYKLKPHHIT